MITVSVEGAPVFLAHQADYEGEITLDFSVMQAVIEWYNSLSKPGQEQAYFQQEALVFCFPQEDGEWFELAIESDGTYPCPDWLHIADACPECLCYVPCDCEPKLVTEADLKVFESQALLGSIICTPDLRRLIYTLREVESQLEVEQ